MVFQWLYISQNYRPILDLTRGPEGDTNIRILQTMISGIPPVLGIGTRMSDPYVDVVLGSPLICRPLKGGAPGIRAERPYQLWFWEAKSLIVNCLHPLGHVLWIYGALCGFWCMLLANTVSTLISFQ